MKSEKMRLKGEMNAILRKADGRVRQFHEENLVVDGGIDFLAAALANSSSRPNVLSHIAIGNGGTAVDASDTALDNELARQAATYGHSTGDSNFTMAATFGAGVGTGDVVEAGVLNAASAGVLFNRVTFSAIPKEAADTLEITFTFTFTPT